MLILAMLGVLAGAPLDGLYVADGNVFAGRAPGNVRLTVAVWSEAQAAFQETETYTIPSDLPVPPVPHPRFEHAQPPFFVWRPSGLPDGVLRVTAELANTGDGLGRAVRVPWQDGWLWALALGPVLGEPGHYESYPTAMVEENGAARMWIGGSWAGDAIFAATGPTPYHWSYVEGTEIRGPEGIPHHPCLAPTRQAQAETTLPGYAHGRLSAEDPAPGEDALHVADPSVVRVPPRSDGERPFYLMYYTGLGFEDPDGNVVFCARSDDAGLVWRKLGPAIRPLSPNTNGYGAGQSSVVLRDLNADGDLELVHFFTDTTVGQPCVAYGDPYGDPTAFTRVGTTGALRSLGNYTWDMKWADSLGSYVGVVALNGPPGELLVAASVDGLDWAGEQARVPLEWLIEDPKQLSCNNGGLLGNPLGHLLEDPLGDGNGYASAVYFYGGGEAMQWEAGEASWDICAIELWWRPGRGVQ